MNHVKGSVVRDGKTYGGLLSRYLSTLITGGDSSEIMEKSDRRELCSDEFIQEVSDYELPPLSHFEIYANKNRVYKSTNLPFYKFSPTPQELKAYEDEQNEIKRIKEIERKRKLDEKRNGKAKATETTKKTKRKRQSMGGHHLVRVSDAIPGPSSQSKSPNSSSQGKRINIDFRVS